MVDWTARKRHDLPPWRFPVLVRRLALCHIRTPSLMFFSRIPFFLPVYIYLSIKLHPRSPSLLLSIFHFFVRYLPTSYYFVSLHILLTQIPVLFVYVVVLTSFFGGFFSCFIMCFLHCFSPVLCIASSIFFSFCFFNTWLHLI